MPQQYQEYLSNEYFDDREEDDLEKDSDPMSKTFGHAGMDE